MTDSWGFFSILTGIYLGLGELRTSKILAIINKASEGSMANFALFSFTLFYYSNFEFPKTESPKETLLTVDSRAKKKEDGDKDFDQKAEVEMPLLEQAIKTKQVSC